MRLALFLTFATLTSCTATSDKDAGDTGDTGGGDSGADTGDTSGWNGGGPLTDPSLADGKTYAFLFDDATITEPATLGSIIAAYMGAPVMFTATVSDSSVSLRGGLGENGSDPATQDTCVPTYDFPSSSFDPATPTFTVGTVDAELYVSGVAVPVYDISITGTFKSDGSEIGNMSYAGLVDTRPIGPLLNGGGGDDAVCIQAKNFGLTCVACPNGAGEFCLSLLAEDIVAGQVPGTLVEVTASCD